MTTKYHLTINGCQLLHQRGQDSLEVVALIMMMMMMIMMMTLALSG
jgi:hypothetical protein